MKTSTRILGRLLWLAPPLSFQTQPLAASDATFTVGDQDFLLDGKPFIIRSGKMHYPRIPREYWTHRLQMARAMGLNTVSTYVFWNLHEPHPGQFDFSGNADVAEFCRLAQREGLKVIVRPGPYLCGEWDFGGLPWWLLKEPNELYIKVHYQDGSFLRVTGSALHEEGVFHRRTRLTDWS